jgi:hypothetical protein
MRAPEVLLLALCTFLSLTCVKGAAQIDVVSSEQLLNGLRNQSITQIALRSSIALSLEDWSSYSLTSPLVIRRNVTILSSPPGFYIDFSLMQVASRKFAVVGARVVGN